MARTMREDYEMYGLHRTLDPKGAGPQAAKKLNAEPRLIALSETLIEVEVLNLDALSMSQLRRQADDGGDEAVVGLVRDIIHARGKMHNPVTDSGGVLVGRVLEIGPNAPAMESGLKVGTLIIPLCSLSAIPLHIDTFKSISGEQVNVHGHAIMFGRIQYATIPENIPIDVALSAIDVSRLPPQVERLIAARKGMRILVMGCGKSGLFAIACARLADPTAFIAAVDVSPHGLRFADSLGMANVVQSVDCRAPMEVLDFVQQRLRGPDGNDGADLVLNCVNVAGTEMPSTLAVKNGGTIVFFSMATSFAKAALGTDGTGKDVTVLIGAGVFPNQADLTFGLMKQCPQLRAYLESLHVPLPKRRPVALADELKELWNPTAAQRESCNLMAFLRFLRRLHPEVPDYIRGCDAHVWYNSLHKWSVKHLNEFWAALWAFMQIPCSARFTHAFEPAPIFRESKFYVNARVNLAETLLRCPDDDRIAVVFRGELPTIPRQTLTFKQLRADVAALAYALRKRGLKKGDRVAAFITNSPAAVIGMLATTSIGAIWSSVSPDSGRKVVLDKFGQISPRVLFAVDSYTYGGKAHWTRHAVAQIVKAIPSIEYTVAVPMVRATAALEPEHMSVQFADMLEEGKGQPLQFEQVPVDHPVFIMFTSGTTGAPKCIVQGYGVVVNHLKESVLHCDVKPSNICFSYTNCGWMVWNWLISVLATGATIVLYDGSPFYPTGEAMWKLIAEERVTYFGTSARFLGACASQDIRVKEDFDMSHLRLITSTGSPLSVASARWVYEQVKGDVQLSSMSGGTELNGCFMLGNPMLPVYDNEIQCAPLGMDTQVFDDHGKSTIGKQGELVCLTPFPSMPLFFWGDSSGDKYHKAYFARFPNVWHHGDFAIHTGRGGFFVLGRSDATLNPGGVRLGTADYYAVVEQLPGVADSVVVGQTCGEAERVVLFVVPKPGFTVDDKMKEMIKDAIKRQLSPKHVPAVIAQVSDVPININFKKMEILVKKIIEDDTVVSATALQNPACLEEYRQWGRAQRSAPGPERARL